MTMRLMMTLVLATMIASVTAPDARAAMFGPDTLQECVQEYVTKTKTNRAAQLINLACNTMFKQYTKDNYLNDTYHLADIKLMPNPTTGQTEPYNTRTGQWDNSKGVRYTLLQSIKAQGRMTPQMQQEMLTIEAEIARKFDSYVKAKREMAECVLEKEEIYEATAEGAVDVIYANSGCKPPVAQP